MKRCFKCEAHKPLAAFYRHKEMADGHLNKCIDCTKRDVLAHRAGSRERIREYDKARNKLPHRLAQIKNYRFDHPDRRKAQATLQRALRSGAVDRWPVCEVPTCDNSRPHAHHPDYSRPLMVVWLCREHHAQAHAIK